MLAGYSYNDSISLSRGFDFDVKIRKKQVVRSSLRAIPLR